ncbi:MAG TPA: hypothetical protein VF677_05420, partial [Flavobacterium sp.]
LWDGHDEESIFASSEFDHEQFEYNGGSGGAHMANGGFYSNEEMVLDAVVAQINSNGWEKSAKHQGYGNWKNEDGSVTFIENKKGGKYYVTGATSVFELQVGYNYLDFLSKNAKAKRERHDKLAGSVAASREYGGDGSGSVQDVALSTLHTIEQFNPVSQMWDAMSIAMGGTDKYGRERNSVDMGYAVVGSIPFLGMEAGVTKGLVNAEKVSGSYLLEFQSGKFYAGKGLEPRMMQSINRIETTYGDKLVKSTFYPASSIKAAFINEHKMMMQFGGPLKFNPLSPTYNKIFSPGKKLGGF